jgi:hypothetical protein
MMALSSLWMRETARSAALIASAKVIGKAEYASPDAGNSANTTEPNNDFLQQAASKSLTDGILIPL